MYPYFFLDFYIKKNKLQINLKSNLIYVLLSIVSDVMPLRKINRIIALNVLNGFKMIFDLGSSTQEYAESLWNYEKYFWTRSVTTSTRFPNLVPSGPSNP